MNTDTDFPIPTTSIVEKLHPNSGDESTIPSVPNPFASVFISYAWGGPLQKKEWLRTRALDLLICSFDTFWDRDSLGYGCSIDDAIEAALRVRPLVVFCLCDADYCKAAETVGSGLNRELGFLTDVCTSDAVRLVPVILDRRCIPTLPPLLRGRTYLDIADLLGDDLYVGDLLASIVLGASQTEIEEDISRKKRIRRVRCLADSYFAGAKIVLHGNANNHVVSLDLGGHSVLIPPAWMQKSPNWAHIVADDYDYFSPSRGIWEWDHSTPSRGMQALGTAVCSIYFPDCESNADIKAIEQAGRILAIKEFSFIKHREPFVFDSGTLVDRLVPSNEGLRALEQLLGA